MSRIDIIEKDIERFINKIGFSEIDGKRILVTGVSGLLGTYFLYTLKKCMDYQRIKCKVHGVCKNEPPKHISDLLDSSYLQLWTGDLCDDRFRNSLPDFDYIIHAAGYGQPAKFVINEEKTIKLNTTVTMDLLNKLKKGGKFLFISSSGIYNGLEKEAFLETDIGTTNTLHPRACYIEGKRCGETICNVYRRKGVEVKSARLSYTYGPGIRKGDQRALYAFISKGMQGRIELLDNGDAERIYCYISDAVEILWDILLYGKNPIYNVGGKEKVTILELAEMVGKILSVPVVVPDTPESISGNAPVERLSIAQIEEEFGKRTFLPLYSGIKNTIDWVSDLD